MEKYLSKFTNLSDYINFRNTDMPKINVSYVESVDRVIYYNNPSNNLKLTLLNPENIPNEAWVDEGDGKGEFLPVRICSTSYTGFRYKSNNNILYHEYQGEAATLRFYKNSDYVVEFLYIDTANYGRTMIGLGQIPDYNPYKLKFKLGGDLYTLGREQNGTEMYGPETNNFFESFFAGNNSIIDFSELYVPALKDRKYSNMFKDFNLESNDTLLMSDFYFDNIIQEPWSYQFDQMFKSLPNTNFGLYMTGKQIANGLFAQMFNSSAITNVPNIMIETADYGGELNFDGFFESCNNLVNIWIPTMNTQTGGITYNFNRMYKNCDALTDLSSYMIDFTNNENIVHNFMLDEMFKSDNGGSLTKGIKVKLNVWDNAFSMSDMYYNQSNLSEIYLLGDNVGTYNGGEDSSRFLNTAGNFPSNGTVYVTDTNITINELNSKFGIPVTWTLAIYSE